MIPSFLYDRFETVRRAFHARWPDKPTPPFPVDATDPNEVIMVIDLMLAPLQNRPPTKITTGSPWIAEKYRDDADDSTD